MFVTAGPAATIAVYLPFESVDTVSDSPSLSIITTMTPEIPGSPGSWTPFAFKSLNTVPSSFPVAATVGGAAVGLALVGGDAVGLAFVGGASVAGTGV